MHYNQAALTEACARTSALRAGAAAERIGRALGALSVRYMAGLQPTADALGRALRLPHAPVAMLSEEARNMRVKMRVKNFLW